MESLNPADIIQAVITIVLALGASWRISQSKTLAVLNDLAETKKEHEAVEERADRLETENSQLKQDVSSMKSDVHNLTLEVRTLREVSKEKDAQREEDLRRILKLEGDVSELTEDRNKLREDLQSEREHTADLSIKLTEAHAAERKATDMFATLANSIGNLPTPGEGKDEPPEPSGESVDAMASASVPKEAE